MMEKFGDSTLNELLINGNRCMQLKYSDRSEVLPSLFPSEAAFLDWTYDFSDLQGVRIDPRFPANGGALAQSGFRWHAVVPPLSPNGGVFCLRKSRFDTLSVEDFDFDPSVLAQVTEHLENGFPLIVCGRTGVGKSSFLCALLRLLYLNQRVIILESLDEIPLLSKLWVKLVSVSPGLEDHGIPLERAMSESLRLSPDRYVVGELRGNELGTFLSAIETGHYGGLSTLHASNEHQVFRRLKHLNEKKIEFDIAIDNLGLLFMNATGKLGLARFTLAKNC